jgi:hypothetical protein
MNYQLIMIKSYIINKKKSIFQIIYKFLKKDTHKLVLGRWNIENNHDKINIKIDNANEDHCGTCSYTKKNN